MNIVRSIRAIIFLFFGLVYIFLTWHLVPELIEIFSVGTQGVAMDPTIKSIVWMGVLITWILAVIIVPIIVLFQTEDTKQVSA